MKQTQAGESYVLTAQLMAEALHLFGPVVTWHHGKGPQRQQRSFVNFGGADEHGAGATQQIEQTVPVVGIVDGVMELTVSQVNKY